MACYGTGRCRSAARRDERKRVSRRVGELASEGIGGQGSRWSTPRLNDLDPCPPIRYASGADVTGYPHPGEPPLSGPGRGAHPTPIPERGPPEAPLFGWELGNLATVPGDPHGPADGMPLGVPQLTAINPSLQHVNSTTVVALLVGYRSSMRQT